MISGKVLDDNGYADLMIGGSYSSAGSWDAHKKIINVECGNQRVSDGIGDQYKFDISRLYTPEALDLNQKSLKHEGIIERSFADSNLYVPYNQWEPAQPIFISAQTGRGKNYFVENELIPYVSEFNYKYKTECRVLILTNRIALWRQIFDRVVLDKTKEREVFSYEDIATITTYQAFLHNWQKYKKIQKHPFSQYVFVVCDEAHFFTSDASFNAHTQVILQKITEVFRNAIRIYMSATPDECLPFIQEEEQKAAENDFRLMEVRYDQENDEIEKWNKRYDMDDCYAVEFLHEYTPIVFYSFDRDYSYLQTKVYSDITELYDTILDTARDGEKWLIFIDNKNQCEKVKNALMERDLEKKVFEDDSILTVNADSKSNDRYKEILETEILGSTKVLISTSVLDNGVNLRDVDNTVVSDLSNVKCIQMAGRARRETPDATKTLYLKRFRQKDIQSRIENLQRQRAAYHIYETYGPNSEQFQNKYHFGCLEDVMDARHWFGISDAGNQNTYNISRRPNSESGGAYFNTIAKRMADSEIDKLIELLQEDEDQMSQAILDSQLKSFGKVYDSEQEVHHTYRQQLVDFLASLASSNVQIVKENPASEEISREEFVTKFKNLWTKTFRENVQNDGFRALNNLLEHKGISYKLDGSAQKGPWYVRSGDWDSDCPAETQKDKDSTAQVTSSRDTALVKGNDSTSDESLNEAGNVEDDTANKSTSSELVIENGVLVAGEESLEKDSTKEVEAQKTGPKQISQMETPVATEETSGTQVVTSSEKYQASNTKMIVDDVIPTQPESHGSVQPSADDEIVVSSDKMQQVEPTSQPKQKDIQ